MADYDYIIVGAGSAGGALASRLSENPANKVLLLEAGAASHPYSRMPLQLRPADRQSRRPTGCYQSEPEPGTANRTIPVPRGKLLGGSSSINGLVWVRGQPLDYDTWAQMGCRGWSWHDVAPLFTRIENFVDGDGSQRPRHRRSAQGLDRARPEPALRRAVQGGQARPASSSTPTTTARTRKASSRRRPRSTRAGA